MIAYKTYIVIENPDRVIPSDLPFKPGQRVEVVLIAEESDGQRAAQVEAFQALFKATQALPEARALTEDEIAAEIAAQRSGR